MNRARWFEIAGAASGLVGAWLLADKGPHAAWGWVAFLASNFALIVFGALQRHWFLALMQVGFTYTSVLGIWRWLL